MIATKFLAHNTWHWHTRHGERRTAFINHFTVRLMNIIAWYQRIDLRHLYEIFTYTNRENEMNLMNPLIFNCFNLQKIFFVHCRRTKCCCVVDKIAFWFTMCANYSTLRHSMVCTYRYLNWHETRKEQKKFFTQSHPHIAARICIQ